MARRKKKRKRDTQKMVMTETNYQIKKEARQNDHLEKIKRKRN